MTYEQFLAVVKERGFTLAQLRCDIPPGDDVMDLIDEVGATYEAFVLRYSTVEAISE